MSDATLIVLGLLSIAGSIIVTQLLHFNKIKFEKFKLWKSNTLAVNKLQFKKLEKQLGVTGAAPKDEKSFVDTLKGLDVDKIKDLLGYVQKEEEEVGEEEEENIIEGAIKEIVKNPELKKKGLELLDKFTGTSEDKRFER